MCPAGVTVAGPAAHLGDQARSSAPRPQPCSEHFHLFLLTPALSSSCRRLKKYYFKNGIYYHGRLAGCSLYATVAIRARMLPALIE